jgi:hypothetical protein
MVPSWRHGPAVALLAAVVLAGAVSRTGAQPAENSEKIRTYYSKDASFWIPFTPQHDAYRIRQVILHVSEDNGKTYQYVGSASPSDPRFKFTARHDGPYWFAVQTQDVNGQYYPQNNQVGQELQLKIIVDTRKPQIELKPVQSRDSAVVEVDWNAYDENLDVSSLKLDYRPAGSPDWTPLPIIKQAQGKHSWNPNINGRVEVRLQVRDKALNENESIITIMATGSGPQTGSVGTGVGTVAERQQDNLFYVNNKRFNLDYELENVGESKVKHVEIWYTLDLGRTWMKYRDAPPQPPYTVEVAGEGRYGLTLVAVSGVGLAMPHPRPGDKPEVWVEVDTKPPVVQLTSVDTSQVEQGKLTILWRADDKNLALQPITLSISETPEGPWQPFAPRLPNDGKYVWVMPENHPYQFYIRVEATDLAKNVGHATTPRPVAVDTKIPRAKIKGVATDPGTRSGVSPAAEQPPRTGVHAAPPEPAPSGGPPAIPPPGGQL